MAEEVTKSDLVAKSVQEKLNNFLKVEKNVIF